jgi:hypothetical protein
MHKLLLVFLFIFNSYTAILQDDSYRTSTIFGKDFYHSFSVGISFGPEHSGGFPKLAYSLQSGKDKGFYGQIHFATALGFSLSPGLELGYRNSNIGVGYSFSFLGIDNINAYYKWSHNINAQIIVGPIMAKVGTPIHYVNKGKDFESFFNDFIKINQAPVNIELLYHNYVKKSQ